MANEPRSEVGRRGFLGAAGSFAAASLLLGTDAQASAQATGSGRAAAHATGRRKLGKLEVSSIGLELNASVSSIEIRGARLPDGVLRMSGVEAPPKS